MKLFQSLGQALFYLPFFILCGLFLLITHEGLEQSRQGIKTIAPENLRGRAETFRLNLLVEKQLNDIHDITDSKAWKDMEADLSDCADRLALHESQMYRRNMIIMVLYVGSTLLFFIPLIMRSKPPEIRPFPSTPLTGKKAKESVS